MKNFLRGLFTRRNRTHANPSKVGESLTRRCRPAMERLEDRTVPATIITILDSGVGSLDGFLSATDGTIDITDGGAAPGTLSRAALEGVNSNVNISITA